MLKRRTNNLEKDMVYRWCIVVTYDPNFKNINFVIRKNLQLLYADPETEFLRQHLLSLSEVLGI